MDELGLRSYPKTSGATGLHVLAPIKPEVRFPDVRRLAKALAEEVERRVGDQSIATTTWRVADRVGVFVDFGQNARDRTIASAYSVRPTPDARVSAPLLWDEVATVEPEAFTLETMPARIDAVGDPMRGMWRNPPSLRPRFAQARPRAAAADVTGLREPKQRFDAGGVRVARRAQLAPRAVARLLVLAPADELRAVAEAVALHLVVAHLDDELRPHGASPRARPSPTGSAPRSAGPTHSSSSGRTRAATSARIRAPTAHEPT